MYRSARARRARRRRLQKMALAGIAVVVLAITAAAVAGSGGDGHEAVGCVILDVSESTAEARTRYPEEFRTFATSIAEEGSGELCLVLAAADPLAEGAPVFTNVAPAPDNEGRPAGVVEVEQKIEIATAEVLGLTQDHGIREGGSGLVEAAVVASEHLQPGDELIYLSDGLQWSKAGGQLMKMDLSASGIANIIDTLEERKLIPDLEGVKVYFPLMLYHPQGYEGNVVEANKIKDFWRAWAQATGAELISGRLG